MQGPEALVEPAIDWRIDWNIDEDIRRAETLPAEVYRDPRHFALARERGFARSRPWAAGTDAMRGPGPLPPRAALRPGPRARLLARLGGGGGHRRDPRPGPGPAGPPARGVARRAAAV